MRRSTLVLPLLLLPLSRLPAQATPRDSLAQRHFSVLAGGGNSFAGWGGTAELFLVQNRLSAIGSLGYLQRIDATDGRTGFAAGLRGYTGGVRHRAFLEASYAPVRVGDPATDLGVHYGPALAAGYAYTARSGFTFLISRGVGWSSHHSGLALTGNIGIGYTWRR